MLTQLYRTAEKFCLSEFGESENKYENEAKGIFGGQCHFMKTRRKIPRLILDSPIWSFKEMCAKLTLSRIIPQLYEDVAGDWLIATESSL